MPEKVERFGSGIERATQAIIQSLDAMKLTEPQKYAALLAATYTQREYMLRERMDSIVDALEQLHNATTFELKESR